MHIQIVRMRKGMINIKIIKVVHLTEYMFMEDLKCTGETLGLLCYLRSNVLERRKVTY